MRTPSPPCLETHVSDFLNALHSLPNWSPSSENPIRGNYQWGNWSDLMRHQPLWEFGGPFRALIMDIRHSRLLLSITLHGLKDMIVWEIVEQAYMRAERRRGSSVTQDMVKMRIRSVFSWQRRHNVRKNSLIWLIDFAFVLCAYLDYSATLLFTGVPLGIVDPTNLIPNLTPEQIGDTCQELEREMLDHSFLPFYLRIPSLNDNDVVFARRLAEQFIENLPPPLVTMQAGVRETRGMSREDKKVDFMTPWLQSMSCASCPQTSQSSNSALLSPSATPRPSCHCENAHRWHRLVFCVVMRNVVDKKAFVKEVCRITIMLLLTKSSMQNATDKGYIYDIAPTTALEQSERELLVFVRIPGTKRKKTVARRTFRGELDSRIEQFVKLARSNGAAGFLSNTPRQTQSTPQHQQQQQHHHHQYHHHQQQQQHMLGMPTSNGSMVPTTVPWQDERRGR